MIGTRMMTKKTTTTLTTDTNIITFANRVSAFTTTTTTATIAVAVAG